MSDHYLKKIWHYAKPYRLPLYGFLLCVCFTSFSVLAIGKGLVYFIDQGLATGQKTILLHSLLILLLIVTLLAVAMFGRFFLITYFGEKIIADLRSDLFKHLLKLPPEFFEKNKVGELLSLISNDLAILQTVITSNFSLFIRNFIIFLGCIIILISLNPKLTLVVFALVPLIVLPLLILGKKLKKLSKFTQEKIALMSESMSENISNVKLIQSFNNEDYARHKFDTALQEALTATKERILLRSILTVAIIVIVFSGVAVILYQGGVAVFAQKFSAGEFSAFLFYTIMLAGSFMALADIVAALQKAQGATARLFEILDAKSTIKDGKAELANFATLEFKNVSFKYPSRNKNSLEKLSFKISQGDIVALVGSSGAGKSTIFDLLLRFYDISAGDILINGQNIKNYSLKSLRKNFALNSQDNIMFSTSVLENLTFAKQNISKSNISEALKLSKAADFINKLPEKIKTHLGDKGIRLSAGEKQRLAIARSILKDSAVILLDEPTSNLDTKNEKLIQDFIAKYRGKKTIIVIAHRLSTIQDFDKIMVVDQGRIVESGNHQELVKKNGFYKKLLDI